jgi:hypothetical protein
MDEPLIATSKGNIPLRSVVQVVEWDINDERILFVEKYLLDGEVVKQSSHVRMLTGVAMEGVAEV